MLPFTNEVHQSAFQCGTTVTDETVHGYFRRIYGAGKDFPLIEDDDPQGDTKRAILASLELAHEDYEGAIPWTLLSRIAEALVLRSGETGTVVSPQVIETDDSALLTDAAIHAMESTSAVYLDLARRTSAAGGLIYRHAHDCDDCGVTAKIEMAPLTKAEIARFGGNYISQVFATIEAMQRGLPFKMLGTCANVSLAA